MTCAPSRSFALLRDNLSVYSSDAVDVGTKRKHMDLLHALVNVKMLDGNHTDPERGTTVSPGHYLLSV